MIELCKFIICIHYTTYNILFLARKELLYERSRTVAPRTSKMESCAITAFKSRSYCCKAFPIRCLRGAGYTSGGDLH